MMIKYCPDLTGYEQVKALLVGNGDFVRPVLNACLKHNCVAYANGRCLKYKNSVELEVKYDDHN